MFKEVVSLAIILGFIWNILYVEHPDTRSYTIAFSSSWTGRWEPTRGWTRDITDQHAFLRGPLEDEMVCDGNCKSKQAHGLMVRSESTPKAASLQVITLYIAAVSEDDSYKHGNGGSDHHGDEMKPYPILLSARSAWNWSAVSSLSGDFPR
ncbi:uncharacterized protein L3040_000916 [Drepanopeziza brunnea f. sp. 'multigermtubi']|uniref:uncharacterized protein n=1 Tax=Drepanopeziza brunnea f. sp. 'multigermtubi' TaxID=698441 RepID=UPI0023A5A3CC|nr:hypothetical protein L3040_000916 [Drepanopeziza brunnea f. sp. 'multigermtubi']